MRAIFGMITALICAFALMVVLVFMGEDFRFSGMNGDAEASGNAAEAISDAQDDAQDDSAQANDAEANANSPDDSDLSEEESNTSEQNSPPTDEGATGLADAASDEEGAAPDVESDEEGAELARAILSELTGEPVSDGTEAGETDAIALEENVAIKPIEPDAASKIDKPPARKLETDRTASAPSLDEASQNDGAGRILPHNLNLFISETAQHRLHPEDLAGFPDEVILALWPDSELMDDGGAIFLLSPPVDIMEVHYLREIVRGQADYYPAAFEQSQGIMMRRNDAMTRSSELTKIVYQALAEHGKTVILYSGNIDPELGKLLAETTLDYGQIDYIIDTSKGKEIVKKQWDALVAKSRSEVRLNVMIEGHKNGLRWLADAI